MVVKLSSSIQLFITYFSLSMHLVIVRHCAEAKKGEQKRHVLSFMGKRLVLM